MLLNKAETRRYILERAKLVRAWHPTRVSESAYVLLEHRLRAEIEKLLRAHPSRGTTFYGE